MKLKKIAAAAIAVFLLIQPAAIAAFETDQYNRPEKPLADIGDEVTDYAHENITRAIAKVNAQIARRESCLASTSRKNGCDSPERETAKLRELRSESAIARAVFRPLGGGIPPLTNSGSWMESHRFRAQPARFKTSYAKSIYRASPVLFWTISETVRIYGVEMGTDKIAHFYQQGYSYYQKSESAKAENLPAAEGLRRAVRWGRMTEKTYYGYWVSGVYSNADLAANYAGMKFYENLTREVTIGARVLPPLLVLKNGLWAFNEAVDRRAALLKPFISEHLNEALNPSHFAGLPGFRAAIRKTVKKQACPQWRALDPARTREDYAAATANLKLWHGEDYGFKPSKNFITIADTCFDN